ncbi:hypothetical protein ZHAS_00022207 [Anopheles sinensis]|uniref:Uncharacterized protein n=1 Tax=Anopheles sinensis TaxID=74873 RepID=A0A084WUR5_ANOSI|nr:hypothetical protein ZHAS_00022207 [Anopheles sinensis]
MYMKTWTQRQLATAATAAVQQLAPGCPRTRCYYSDSNKGPTFPHSTAQHTANNTAHCRLDDVVLAVFYRVWPESREDTQPSPWTSTNGMAGERERTAYRTRLAKDKRAVPSSVFIPSCSDVSGFNNLLTNQRQKHLQVKNNKLPTREWSSDSRGKRVRKGVFSGILLRLLLYTRILRTNSQVQVLVLFCLLCPMSCRSFVVWQTQALFLKKMLHTNTHTNGSR